MFSKNRLSEKIKKEAIIKMIRKELEVEDSVFNGFLKYDIKIEKERYLDREDKVELTFNAKVTVKKMHFIYWLLYILTFSGIWSEEGFYSAIYRVKKEVSEEVDTLEGDYNGTVEVRL